MFPDFWRKYFQNYLYTYKWKNCVWYLKISQCNESFFIGFQFIFDFHNIDFFLSQKYTWIYLFINKYDD